MRWLTYISVVAIPGLCLQAQAWPPATHAYLAERITGYRDPEIMYGATMVDFHGTLIANKKADKALKRIAHDEFHRLEPSKFAVGFATHNALWGADYYAHLYYDKSADPIYSTLKIRQLSQEFAISMQKAEDSFEGVIEFMIRIEYGPELGRLMAEGARDTHEEELARAFAAPLAKRTGMSVEQAAGEVRKAARGFQVLADTYAKQLVRDDDDYLRFLAVLAIQGYLGRSHEEAERYFTRVIELCEDDYQAEMDRIVRNIRDRMLANPLYAPYCKPTPAAGQPEAP